MITSSVYFLLNHDATISLTTIRGFKHQMINMSKALVNLN